MRKEAAKHAYDPIYVLKNVMKTLHGHFKQNAHISTDVETIK